MVAFANVETTNDTVLQLAQINTFLTYYSSFRPFFINRPLCNSQV